MRAGLPLTVFVALCTLASSASAATITVTTYLGGMGDCGGTHPQTHTDVSQETSITSGPCAFQFGWGGTGSAAARGVFDESGLSLGAMAVLDGRSSTTAEGIAYFTDTVTPLGEPGTNGYLQFVMSVDGERGMHQLWECLQYRQGVWISPDRRGNVHLYPGTGRDTPRGRFHDTCPGVADRLRISHGVHHRATSVR